MGFAGRSDMRPICQLYPSYKDWLRGIAGLALLGLRRLPFHVLTVQADKIDRIEHQRRETAIAHRGGDDFPGKREQ